MTGVQTCALPISPKPQNPKTPNYNKKELIKIKINYEVYYQSRQRPGPLRQPRQQPPWRRRLNYWEHKPSGAVNPASLEKSECECTATALNGGEYDRIQHKGPIHHGKREVRKCIYREVHRRGRASHSRSPRGAYPMRRRLTNREGRSESSWARM